MVEHDPMLPTRDVAERTVRALFERDPTSQDLGIEILEVVPGCTRLTMEIRANMVNCHKICHGGYVFLLADSAFQFCCNSSNVMTVAAGATIDFVAPAHQGDRLFATAKQLWRSRRTGLYEVDVTNQHGVTIAFFRGRSHALNRPAVVF